MKTATILFLLASLMSASASQLPFLETFEVADGVTSGTINGQNGWVLNGGTGDVQSGTYHTGSQALQIQNAGVAHDLSTSNSAVWLSFQVRCDGIPDATPTVTDANTSLAFFINPSLNVVVYSNTTPVELTAQMPTNTWVRFDVYCDYDDMQWNLNMDGISIAAGLPLYSTNNQLGSLLVQNDSAFPVYLDQFDLSDVEQTANVPDTDSDLMPDWWEQKYLGGVTAGDPDAISGNAGYTYLETYIAGLSPATFDPFVAGLVPDGNGLSWNPVPSRLYSVHWTPSLTDAFTLLQGDIPYPQSEYLDMIHNGDSAGFYKLKVEVVQ